MEFQYTGFTDSFNQFNQPFGLHIYINFIWNSTRTSNFSLQLQNSIKKKKCQFQTNYIMIFYFYTCTYDFSLLSIFVKYFGLPYIFIYTLTITTIKNKKQQHNYPTNQLKMEQIQPLKLSRYFTKISINLKLNKVQQSICSNRPYKCLIHNSQIGSKIIRI